MAFVIGLSGRDGGSGELVDVVGVLVYEDGAAMVVEGVPKEGFVGLPKTRKLQLGQRRRTRATDLSSAAKRQLSSVGFDIEV